MKNGLENRDWQKLVHYYGYFRRYLRKASAYKSACQVLGWCPAKCLIDQLEGAHKSKRINAKVKRRLVITTKSPSPSVERDLSFTWNEEGVQVVETLEGESEVIFLSYQELVSLADKAKRESGIRMVGLVAPSEISISL